MTQNDANLNLHTRYIKSNGGFGVSVFYFLFDVWKFVAAVCSFIR